MLLKNKSQEDTNKIILAKT